MSNARKPKTQKKSTPILMPWDEVLLGNKALFNKLTDPYVLFLLDAARKDVAREVTLGNFHPDWLQAEELVGETLVQAWYMRHGRSERKSIKEWLLEVQKYTFQKIIQEEKSFFNSIAVSLEDLAPPELKSKTEIGFDEWLAPYPHDRWADIIPDENSQLIAA